MMETLQKFGSQNSYRGRYHYGKKILTFHHSVTSESYPLYLLINLNIILSKTLHDQLVFPDFFSNYVTAGHIHNIHIVNDNKLTKILFFKSI